MTGITAERSAERGVTSWTSTASAECQVGRQPATRDEADKEQCEAHEPPSKPVSATTASLTPTPPINQAIFIICILLNATPIKLHRTSRAIQANA